MTAPVDGGTAPGLDFTLEIDATRDLGAHASRVEALVTVTAHQAGMAGPAARAAEVLIMDRSRSMMGENKIHEAHRAACAAIDALPDGVLLGIIGGNREAEPVYPRAGGLAVVDAGTKAAAKRQVMSLRPEGGTEIGRWLTAAGELFATEPDAGFVRHAVLYTDGKNEHETPEALDAALSGCADRFVCDVRGVGGDWHYAELRHIAEMLHGDATAVLRIADLAEDFTQLMHRVQRLVVPRAYLRVQPGGRFGIGSIAQTYPVRVDLTRHQQPAAPALSAGGAAVDVPLGPWERQTRRYQLSLRFDPAALPPGDEVRAARVELLTEATDGTRERRASAALVVRRHATPDFRTAVPESLTRVEQERELGLAMQACADAWLRGQAAAADDELNLTIRLAREVRDVRLPLLEDVAVTGPDGRARLRPDVTPGEMQRLGLDSTKTAFTAAGPRPANRTFPGDGARPPGDGARRPADGGGSPPARVRTCPGCGQVTRAASLRFCEACGRPFDGEAAS
ncbi:MAG TPA: vWA domain-containing protein [Streptosporangiaceae bacterium]|nr:vWA domain-containing protein [Streptosporangiaceae bacterium]